mgnify:CR=1 FL=1
MVYERITRKLRYSLIRFFVSDICASVSEVSDETAEKNVPLNMIKKMFYSYLCTVHTPNKTTRIPMIF